MRTIIIGSGGFIGSHLAEYMAGRGHETWCADIADGRNDTERFYLLEERETLFDHVFSSERFDLCVNCSGAANVHESLADPIRDFRLNTINVFKILESIRIYQPGCRFINLSSAAVYGNPVSLPIGEDAAVNPLSPYGWHKLFAENGCREYHDLYDLKTCSLRIFSVYGKGLRKQLFWDLYNKAAASNHFNLFGTGNESRDFIHVDDLVRVIEIISCSSDFRADIVNVANGSEVLIKDAVSVFLGFFGREIPYSFSGDTRKGDPQNWEADISRLRAFGYKPSVDIYSGLKEYYNWITNIKS